MTLFTDLLNTGPGTDYFPSTIFQQNMDCDFAADNGGSGVKFNGTTTTSYQTIFSYTGKGILQALAYVESSGSTTGCTTRITIDGSVFTLVRAGTDHGIRYVGQWASEIKTATAPPSIVLAGLEAIPFNTSILVEHIASNAGRNFDFVYKYIEADSSKGSSYFPSTLSNTLSTLGEDNLYMDSVEVGTTTGDGTFNTVTNITKKGIIQSLSIRNTGATTNTIDVRITIDGTVFNISETMTNAAGGSSFMSIFGVWGQAGTASPFFRAENVGYESIPFDTEYKVEIKAPIAAGVISFGQRYVEVQ